MRARCFWLDAPSTSQNATIAGFLDFAEFAKHTIKADDLIRSPANYRDQFAGAVVIVGSDAPEDYHSSPLSDMLGVTLNANYIEAYLDRRVYTRSSEDGARLIELVLIFLLTLASMEPRLPLRVLQTTAVFAVSIVVSYVAFTSFGIFFDFVVPLTVMLVHTAVDGLLERRGKMLANRNPRHHAGA